MDKHYSYFSHRQCEYFPCHPGADPENFNCLFCYCPLYLLGDKCGGNFVMHPDGRKGELSGDRLPVRRDHKGDAVKLYEKAKRHPDPDGVSSISVQISSFS